MVELLQITQLGNPVLREHARTVSFPLSEGDNALIDSMIVTMLAAEGVGIAAPQVDQSLDVFIVASRPSPRYPDARLMEAEVVINPEILTQSAELEKGWEGCLSIPGIRGLVPRAREISVKYFDRSGNEIHRTFAGFVARIFQHEYDHLRGIVFLDRMESTRDLVTEQEFRSRYIVT